MDKEKGIVIELSNIRAKKYHKENGKSNHILLGEYYKKIANLIEDRIDEVNSYKRAGFDIDNINEVKMHDAILVYGSRGNGKSTVMINLKDFITGDYRSDETEGRLKNKVKIFETIDPTIQEEDEDFLLVILSAILKEVENHQDEKYSKRDGFYDSLESVLKIVEATRSKKKDDIDIFDKFYGLKSGVGLAEELHNLFKYTKDIFNVDILIIPIDDVDMNLKQGYQIADSIRKYMSSPYIIPIVAFNIRQMRVVTKFHKYKEFNLKIDSKFESDELSFLQSLPNDYLSKVFPPNRRIYLKSVFEILKEATEKKSDHSIIFKFDDIKIEVFDMISLITELFYEFHYGEEIFEDVDSNVFLSNRSMRNFLNDCYCVLASLKKDEKVENQYEIDRKVIKDRLAPDDINAFVTKQHALTWLWNEYIDVAKKNLKSSENRSKNYNWARAVTDMLPEDNSAETINKKTYARVWLQEYYRLDENIIRKDNKFFLTKTCNVVGALELAMRSYIPMYLFETIVKNYNLEYTSSDLVYLRNFSSKSLLDIAYDLSTMEMYLSKKGTANKFTPKPIGSLVVYENYISDIDNNLSIKSKEFNIPFLFKLSNQDKLEGFDNKQIYIVSIFKSMALFIELMKIYQDNRDDNSLQIMTLIEKYKVNIPGFSGNLTEEYFEEYIYKSVNGEAFKNYLNIELEESSFGVIEIAKFSKKLSEFFMNVRENIEDRDLNSFSSNSSNKNHETFYYPLITYFTSFAQSLFISLFNSIRKEQLFVIKILDKKDRIIYSKNSLYGTKIAKVEDSDNLYEKNICNLKYAVKINNNRKNGEYKEFKNEIKRQNDFDNLFNYINHNVPFFKFLIDKSTFLKKLKEDSCP